MSGKSSRREIPVAKKLEVLKRNRNGEKLYRLEQDTGFQRAQIKNWLKNEYRLLSVKVKQKRKRVSQVQVQSFKRSKNIFSAGLKTKESRNIK